MCTVRYDELNKILGNLNNRENLTYANILEAIRIQYPEFSDQLQSDVNSYFLVKGIKTASCTLLGFASKEGYVVLVNTLLACEKIDVNAQEGKGWAALHYAAKGGHADIVELLLAKEANSLLTNDDGKTPKDLAVSKSYDNIVKMLKIKKNCAFYPVTNTNSGDKKANNMHVKSITNAEQTARGNAIVGGVVTAALGVAITIALFATEVVPVELMSVGIALSGGIFVTGLAALAVGAIVYKISKPTEMNEIEHNQCLGTSASR